MMRLIAPKFADAALAVQAQAAQPVAADSAAITVPAEQASASAKGIPGNVLSQALRARTLQAPVRFGNSTDNNIIEFQDDEVDVVTIPPELIDPSLQKPLITAIKQAEKDGTLTLSHIFVALLENPETSKPLRKMLQEQYGIAPAKFENILRELKSSWDKQNNNSNVTNCIPLVDRDYVETMDALNKACTEQGVKITLGLLLLSVFNQKANVVGETMQALATTAPSNNEEEESPLMMFSRDMTLAYEMGDQSPVFGRDKQVAQLINILSQAKKANGVLVGEAGVGKTAIVEKLAELTANGFAGFDSIPPGFEQRDEDGNVKMIPTGEVNENGLVRKALPKRILELDLDKIAAEGVDAKKVMGAVLEEAVARKDEVLLFVDEIHKMNDKQNSFNNFANQLKPYLARGDIRVIGSTTLDEYRKEFATDPALARRFAPVMVDEPTPDESMAIARGVKPYFEKKHGVTYRDDALEEAIKKGKRYLTQQQAPDSFIELLDRAGAQKKNEVKLGPTARLIAQGKVRELDLNIKGWGNRLDDIRTDSGALNVKSNAIVTEVYDKLADLRDKNAFPKQYEAVMKGFLRSQFNTDRTVNLLAAAKQFDEILKKQDEVTPGSRQEALNFVLKEHKLDTARYEKENRLWIPFFQENLLEEAKRMKTVRQGMAALEVLTKGAREKRRELIAEKDGLQASLESKTISPIVTISDVLAVIEEKTGIPVSKLGEDESERLNNMETEMGKRLIGQKPTLRAVCNAVRNNRQGLSNPNKPIGSFLFLGPTGTGKTELAKTLAEFLFDDETAIIRIDMSEYQAEHTVAKLFGAPPGYVGYEEGGKLTNEVRQRPSSVILLDEIEKAHPKVFDTLLQVLDDGRMTDGQGKTVSFKDTVIIATSNIGSPEQIALFKRATSTGDLDPDSKAFDDLYNNVQRRVKTILKEHPSMKSRPEFLNRFDDIVTTHALMRDHQREIAKLEIKKLTKWLHETDYKVKLSLTDEALEYLLDVTMEFEMGARPVVRGIGKYIKTPIGKRLGKELHSGDNIVITKDQLQEWVREASKT